jgi:four helix bundle protein
MSDFKNLEVWKKSMDLVTNIYKIVVKFPKSETYWLIDQIKRSCISVPSNIAEW